jgi:outer membrane protein assembly factor BamB
LATTRYRINSPHVVAETLDGEATIVDLDSGTYYALNESGSFIWDELTRGSEPAAVAEAFSSSYGLEAAESARTVEQLLSQLSEQRLLVPAPDGGSNGSAPATASSPTGNGAGNGRPYSAPELSTYTDMQELLLLDPIHEVDESGWPSQV